VYALAPADERLVPIVVYMLAPLMPVTNTLLLWPLTAYQSRISDESLLGGIVQVVPPLTVFGTLGPAAPILPTIQAVSASRNQTLLRLSVTPEVWAVHLAPRRCSCR